MSIFALVDDKHIPLYRVLWISELPHFCGEDECEAEGRYEVRLEQNESLFASLAERDNLLRAIAQWQSLGDQFEE